MPKKKPQGDIQDIIKWIDRKVSGGAPKKGATVRVSATTRGISSSRKKTVKKAAAGGHKFAKGAEATAKYAFGDPKKGARDVAANTAMWVLPYGKGAKAINKGVNAVVKGKKTAKAVRGAVKTAGAVTAPAVADKAIRNTGKRKLRKGTR